MNSKNLGKIIALGLVTLPTVAFAANSAVQNFLDNVVKPFGDIVKLLVPIVFALAILAFFYGIMLYVFSTSTGTKKNGRDIMLWALVAIAIMVSLYGIIGLAQNTFGIDNTNVVQPGSITAPTVK